MRHSVKIVCFEPVPFCAKKPSHSLTLLGRRLAGARIEGQGRRSVGAWRVPLAVASTLAGRHPCGDRTVFHYAALVLVGVLSTGASTTLTVAQPAAAASRAPVDPHVDYIAEASQRFGIPAAWIQAVIRVESAGDMRAVSSAGARGLMQVMPETWAGLRVRHRLGQDPFDPRDNILAGTAYLREMYNRYGNIGAMLAAYNAGPQRYDEYLSAGRALPAETRAYVAALAPALSGNGFAEGLSMPPDWREAPLFTGHSGDAFAAAELTSGEQSGDRQAAISARDSAQAEPQDDGLFVVRTGAGASP